MKRAWVFGLCAVLFACPVPVTVGRQFGVAPRVLYTDIVSGPLSGGEANLGAYLSIFGKHFGTDLGAIRVFIGGAEVAKYVSLGTAKGRGDVQQITVQVGALGSPTPGQALPIDVRVNGQSSNTTHTFTPQPGDTLFVDTVSGDDATAVKNDLTHPWKTLQTPSGGGALSQARAGDFVVLRGHGLWADVGLDNRWVHFGPVGSAPTGQPGTGPLTVMAYPQEDVHFVPKGGTRGGLHGASVAPFVTWLVIAGLRIEGGDASVTDGPIVLQNGSDHWRVVNNDVGPWAAGSAARAGGITGNGTFVDLIGNRVHELTGGLTNCIDLDDHSADVDVSWNSLVGCRAGSGVQTIGAASTLERLAIHHNFIRDTARYGVVLAEGTLSAHVWDNVIVDTDQAGIRVNLAAGTVNTVIEHNTVVHPCRGADDAALVNTSAANTGSVRVANNVFVKTEGTTCVQGYATSAADSAFTFERNAWSGFVAPAGDGEALTPADGGLTFDFHLSPTSALVDASRNSNTPDDADGAARVGTPDVGAYEWVPPLPSSPVSLAIGCSSAGAAPWAVGVLISLLAGRRARARTSLPVRSSTRW